MRDEKHSPRPDCMLCEVPGDLMRVEQRMLIAERDITNAAISLRETETRWLEHMQQFSAEVARLQDFISTLIRSHHPG